MARQQVERFEPLVNDASELHAVKVRLWKDNLASENSHERIEAQNGLAQARSVQAFRALTETLSHPNSKIRLESAYWLASHYHTPQTFRALVRAFRHARESTQPDVLAVLAANRHPLATSFAQKHFDGLRRTDQVRVITIVRGYPHQEKIRLIPFLKHVRIHEDNAGSDTENALNELNHPDADLALAHNPSWRLASQLKWRILAKLDGKVTRHALTLAAHHSQPELARHLLETTFQGIQKPSDQAGAWNAHADSQAIKPWLKHVTDANGNLRFDPKATALTLLRVLNAPLKRPLFKNPAAFILSIKQTAATVPHAK